MGDEAVSRTVHFRNRQIRDTAIASDKILPF